MIKKKSGITLIALIITIIVLLILAGISISTITGENGTLKRAGDASEKTKDAKEDEQVKLVVSGALSDGVGELTTDNLKKAIGEEFGEDKKEKLTGDGPWVYEGERNIYNINKNGVIDKDTSIDISKYVKIGDYINYHPTFMNKDGTQKVDDEKLTYESVKRFRELTWKW